MFLKKLKISAELLAKLEQAALAARCTTWEEFANQVLNTEADRIIQSTQSKDLSKDEVQAIENQLRGLGYLE